MLLDLLSHITLGGGRLQSPTPAERHTVRNLIPIVVLRSLSGYRVARRSAFTLVQILGVVLLDARSLATVSNDQVCLWAYLALVT
jgi:hypothetical protein